MYMEKIASFTVDHNKLNRGIYTSRVDGDCYTFDLRMKKPNTGDVLATDAMHAIEHIGATWLRSSRFKDQIIYFGLPHRILSHHPGSHRSAAGGSRDRCLPVHRRL